MSLPRAAGGTAPRRAASRQPAPPSGKTMRLNTGAGSARVMLPDSAIKAMAVLATRIQASARHRAHHSRQHVITQVPALTPAPLPARRIADC